MYYKYILYLPTGSMLLWSEKVLFLNILFPIGNCVTVICFNRIIYSYIIFSSKCLNSFFFFFLLHHRLWFNVGGGYREKYRFSETPAALRTTFYGWIFIDVGFRSPGQQLSNILYKLSPCTTLNLKHFNQWTRLFPNVPVARVFISTHNKYQSQ